MKQISQLADNAKTNQAANNAEAAPAPYIAVAEFEIPLRGGDAANLWEHCSAI